MALTSSGRRGAVPGSTDQTTTAGPATSQVISKEQAKVFGYVTAALRIALGWVFLWAFLDKLFGLGHETESKAAWINGGSPTDGFLSNATAGPFADMYQKIAGQTWADWLFMIGLAGIGTALIAGVAMRIATAGGALLLFLMWTAVLPPENNPFMDDHLVYALVLIALVLVKAGHVLGLGKTWEQLPIVKKYPVLR
jgi:thiosulfate dehydrogenase (quinone) large subunit